MIHEHYCRVLFFITIFILISMVLKVHTASISNKLAIACNLLDLSWFTCVRLYTICKCSSGIEKVPLFYLFLGTKLCLLDSTIFSSPYRFLCRLSNLLAYIRLLLRVGVAGFRRCARRKLLVERLEPVRVLLETSLRRSFFNEFPFRLPTRRRLRGIA